MGVVFQVMNLGEHLNNIECCSCFFGFYGRVLCIRVSLKIIIELVGVIICLMQFQFSFSFNIFVGGRQLDLWLFGMQVKFLFFGLMLVSCQVAMYRLQCKLVVIEVVEQARIEGYFVVQVMFFGDFIYLDQFWVVIEMLFGVENFVEDSDGDGMSQYVLEGFTLGSLEGQWVLCQLVVIGVGNQVCGVLRQFGFLFGDQVLVVVDCGVAGCYLFGVQGVLNYDVVVQVEQELFFFGYVDGFPV